MKDTAQNRYDAKNRVPVVLRLNRKTDADVLSRLAEAKGQPGGMQGYIKALIRADMGEKK